MQREITYINCAYDVQRDDRISWLLVLEIGCKITVKISHRQEMNDNAEKCFVDAVIITRISTRLREVKKNMRFTAT